MGGADIQKKLDELLSGASRSLSAEEAAAGLRNPAYKVVTTKQTSDPVVRGRTSGGRPTYKALERGPVEFETNMAELDREWLSDAIASGIPDYDDISPAPAPRKSQPGPGDFSMAFDMNDYSPWLRKRRGSLMG